MVSLPPDADAQSEQFSGVCPSAAALQLEQYRSMLHGHAKRHLGRRLRPRLSPSDVVQDTFLTAVSTIHSYRGTSDLQMRAWLLQILRTRIIDAARRHLLAAKRRSEAERNFEVNHLRANAASPPAAAADGEQIQLMREAIERLEPQLRQIVWRRHLCGASLESISSETGLSSATVWRRCNEAIDRLRMILNRPADDEPAAAAEASERHSAVSR